MREFEPAGFGETDLLKIVDKPEPLRESGELRT